MVSLRRILAILTKDLRDGGRDGRILVLLLLPIGMAVFYNATFTDPDELPTTDVAIVDSGGHGVARELRAAAGKSVKVQVRQTRDAASARRLVAANDVDFAVVVAPTVRRAITPAGVAAAPTPRRAPAPAEILVAEDASPTAQSVVALVPDALTRADGSEPAAQTQVRAVAAAVTPPYGSADPRTTTVLLVIVLHLVFVAMMAVPIQTAEELETGTFSALRLAATGPEILAAKAFAGFIYGLAGVGLIVLLTKLDVHDPSLFFGAAFGLIVSLVGFGLLIGLLWPNSNSINTYASFLLVPLVGLAGAVLFVQSGVLATILDVLPFSQATKLLADGLSAQPPFHAGLGSWAVIAAWSLVGYLILARIASRREI